MATLRECFDTDFGHYLSVHCEWKISSCLVTAKILQDHKANSKFWSFFVQSSFSPSIKETIRELIELVISNSNFKKCIFNSDLNGNEDIITKGGFEDYLTDSSDLLFTRRVTIYIDEEVDKETREYFYNHHKAELFVKILDKGYAKIRSKYQNPLAFISHDSRDKDLLVRELASKMTTMMCPVWYDEYSLKVGDSLRESIESGLKKSKKCIIILSSNFIENNGWTKAEFDSIFTREIHERKNIILPVWHNINKQQVYNYCPRLLDKVALNSSEGIDSLAHKLVSAILQ